MPLPPVPVIIPVTTVPAVTPVPISPSVTARVGGALLPAGAVQEEVMVRVKPEIDPVQLATEVVVCTIFSVPDGEMYCVIGNQTKSTPMLFNSTRVMSTPDLSPAGGGLTPVIGSTVKPIGFGLVGLFGTIVGTPGGGTMFWKGMPAVLGAPVVDVVLNGAQVVIVLPRKVVVVHTSIG